MFEHITVDEKLKSKGYYTTEEVAKILNVHIVTVRRYCKQRKISFYKCGKNRLFSKDDVNAFIRKNYKEAINEPRGDTEYVREKPVNPFITD